MIEQNTPHHSVTRLLVAPCIFRVIQLNSIHERCVHECEKSLKPMGMKSVSVLEKGKWIVTFPWQSHV